MRNILNIMVEYYFRLMVAIVFAMLRLSLTGVVKCLAIPEAGGILTFQERWP